MHDALRREGLGESEETMKSSSLHAARYQTIRGTYRRGCLELDEAPRSVADATVLVTFLPDVTKSVELGDRGITRKKAADLRAKLRTFAQDWNRPEMDAYDEM